MPEFIIKQESIPSTQVPPITVGETLIQKTKSPYTEAQNKAAGFAFRMEQANELLNKVEDSGFNPVNLKDFSLENFPLIGGSFITRFLMSPKYKQYGTAKIDFSTAQLRRETGAVINASEIDWINLTYFPQVGDDEATLKIKRNNRDKAIRAMKTEAGAAYDKIVESNPKQEALQILIQRASTNPQLKELLIQKGLLKNE